MIKKDIPFTALICLVVASAAPADIQATFHVAPDGNDTNTSSESEPFAMIDKARQVVRTVKDDKGMNGDHDWYPFFSTDPNATVVEIIEAFADRATIEQDFHDVKEVWGAGQQQVRNIWTNLAVYHLNLWMHKLVELWSWHRSHDEFTDRSQSPWDDAARRPSHTDRRKALRQHIIQTELSTLVAARWLPRKILDLVQRGFGRLNA